MRTALFIVSLAFVHLFRARHIGCLPVMRGASLVGIVTRTDLLAVLDARPVGSAPPVRCHWLVHERLPRGVV